jgi:predicted ester cyclase
MPDLSALVTSFYRDLWNRWDDAAVPHVLAADFSFRGTLGDRTHGRDQWREYRDRVRCAAPDFTNTVLDVVVQGDRAAARLRFAGTHEGELLGIAPTHRSFAYEGAAFFTGAGGLLSDAWVLGDIDGLRRQLQRP